MRPNRNIRLGITLIGITVLGIVVLSLISRWRSRNAGTGTENVANNPNAVTYGGANNAPNGTNNAAGPVVPVALPTAGVVYRTRELIPERSIVTLDMLEPRPWKGEGPPPVGYITNPDQQAAGYITGRAITAGADLMQADLVGHITKVGVAGAIRPGRRAMVIPVVNRATLHELVHIGDYVDIIGTFDQQESRTLVQNVRVLAVDIFGKDYPPVKVAMRGTNKAEPYTPPTPTPPPSPLGVPSGQAAPGPTTGPPPPAPEPALTLEVTTDEATALSLAQASNSPLDFIIRPRSEVLTSPVPGAPVAAIRVVDVNRQQLAPWAYAHKNRATGPAAGNANTSGANRLNVETNSGTRTGRTRNGRRSLGSGYDLPVPPLPPLNNGPSGNMGQGLPPAVVQAPKTYEIPIYAAGKLVRNDVVLKPQQ